MIERYSTPEMNEIWSEESRIDLWLRIEVEAARAWSKLGRVPPEAVEVIDERAAVDIPRMRQIEAETHHDVIAFLKTLGESIGPEARYVHLGMTSSDILDTATAVQIKRAGLLILEELDALCEAVRKLALEYEKTPVMGRTHGVHAEPTSLGLKFAYWWDELSRAGDMLAVAIGAASVGKLSGAVGTYVNLDPAVELHVCSELGLRPAGISSQIVSRDRHAGYLNALAVLGAVIAREALEIRLLARTETSEILEGFAKKQKGSSAMPHKRNAVKCEQLCGLARLLRTNALAGVENIELWHERDISHSSVERIILPDSSTLAHYMIRRFRAVVEQLDIRPDRMRQNIDSSNGLFASGTVLTMLVEKGLSRDEAYDVVQKAAMAARRNGTSFTEEIAKDAKALELIGEDGMTEATGLERHLASTEAVYKRLEIRESRKECGA